MIVVLVDMAEWLRCRHYFYTYLPSLASRRRLLQEIINSQSFSQ